MLSEVHSGAQTAVLSCVRRVLAEPLVIASRRSFSGRERSILDTSYGPINGVIGGSR